MPCTVNQRRTGGGSAGRPEPAPVAAGPVPVPTSVRRRSSQRYIRASSADSPGTRSSNATGRAEGQGGADGGQARRPLEAAAAGRDPRPPAPARRWPAVKRRAWAGSSRASTRAIWKHSGLAASTCTVRTRAGGLRRNQRVSRSQSRARDQQQEEADHVEREQPQVQQQGEPDVQAGHQDHRQPAGHPPAERVQHQQRPQRLEHQRRCRSAPG